MAKFYGIKNGRNIGVFHTWDECKKNVIGFSNAIYKAFDNYRDAYKFVYDGYPDGFQDPDGFPNEGDTNLGENFESEVVAYIDGSYDDSIKRFGYAGIIFHEGERVEFAHSEDTPELIALRNVAGELKAAMHVMDYAMKHNVKSLSIYYDYLGIENWATKKWKTNTDFTRAYASYAREIMESIDIRFIKVKAHSGNKYNEEVDKLARNSLNS